MASGSSTTVNVWSSNLLEELDVISSLRSSFPIIAVDTEFPGFVWDTPRDASEEDRYRDLRLNVDNMELIQLGITMFDEQGRTPGGWSSWQFNFSDFNPDRSICSQKSVDFLRQNGTKFEKNMRDGIPANRPSTADLFKQKLFGGDRRGSMKWVTFHGLYDVAYIAKLLNGGRPLPDTLPKFLLLTRELLGEYLDIKYIARFCKGLCAGEIGLTKMCELMEVQREGTSHQAGHDSLLVGAVFQAMKEKYRIFSPHQSSTSLSYIGVLYGIEKQSQASTQTLLNAVTRPPPPMLPQPPQPQPPRPLSPLLMLGQILPPQYHHHYYHPPARAPRLYYYYYGLF